MVLYGRSYIGERAPMTRLSRRFAPTTTAPLTQGADLGQERSCYNGCIIASISPVILLFCLIIWLFQE